MALQLRTLIGTDLVFLDLFKDEPMNMNISFAEIQDITKKNSSFSQTFSLPGTKTNNRVFDYYYEITSLPTNFDPNKKFPAILTWDGVEIFQGNIRLENVVVSKGDIIYSVTFYNQVGDLAANIGDKFLRETNLDHLDHPYSADVILQSQADPQLVPLTGATNYSYQNGKTFWGLYNIGYNYLSGSTNVDFLNTPLVYFTPVTGATYQAALGYFDFTGSPVWDYYFKPTIQVKELYESICRDAGYEVKSDFFNTAYFQRYYLPLKFLDETPYNRGSRVACFSYSAISVPITSYINYTDPSAGQICNSLSWATTSNSFTIPISYLNQYQYKISFSATPTDFCSVVTPQFELFMNYGPQNYRILTEQVCSFPNSSYYETTFTPWFNYNGVPAPITAQVYFIANDLFIFNFKLEIIAPLPRYLIPGDTVSYAVEFPDNDYKQIDFITSINRYFNLICVPDPDNEQNIIVEPMIDYIGTGGVKDWTKKVDRDSPIKVSPTTSIINGTLNFNFKLDQDWSNQLYQKSSNRIFGTEKVRLNIDYKDSDINFDTIFSSPTDITIFAGNSSFLTLSSFSKLNQQDQQGKVSQSFVPFKILPRVLFRGPVLNNQTYGSFATGSTFYQRWYVRAAGTRYTMDHFQEINRFTTYPFNYNDLSHYTNWRGQDQTSITPPEYAFINDDLYDIYYQDYIEDLTSAESKIVNCKMYLTPWDIKAIDWSEKILVDNNYYRINKINNFNLLEPSICDVELIKLTRDYTPHKKLQIKFSACSITGATYYTNTDYMYNIYAYIGRYVKLYDDALNYLGCYLVMKDESGTGIGQEQHFYLSNAFSNSGVFIYTDCNCSVPAAMNLVQETPVLSPSPTPTPSLTPSITPTMTPTNNNITPSATPTYTPTPSITNPNYTCFFYINDTMSSWTGDYQACDGTWYYGAVLAPSAGVCAVAGTPFTIVGTDLVSAYSCIG
jgi:hypothetical protein